MSKLLAVVAVVSAFVLAPATAWAACGCQGMTLRVGGGASPMTSGYYCAQPGRVPDWPGCAQAVSPPSGTCPSGQVAFRCQLGGTAPAQSPAQPELGWNFEVVATLKPSSTPAQCKTGQVVTTNKFVDGNLLTNGDTADEPVGPLTFGTVPPTVIAVVSSQLSYVPNVNTHSTSTQTWTPVFGADGYEEESRDLKYRVGSITWIDGPAKLFGNRSSRVSGQWEFISFVKASGDGSGECMCRFVIDRTWDGTTAGGRGVVLGPSVNCALET
ncbi:hypothetical protein [Pyxidicoccus sp. MSG2]|uniref:hypothetical protein n=1 Tax=Pyxidicoccus sp. MSG2 TaxID=2996790 RepID=UPI00226E0254|nr:hypothetical protein [Pyxidicoccus sp. MSG2]MCY1020123.1 hypothetical protein [Pyxidicoccus sp. MSG2]